jgi:hypothetical protein
MALPMLKQLAVSAAATVIVLAIIARVPAVRSAIGI